MNDFTSSNTELDAKIYRAKIENQFLKTEIESVRACLNSDEKSIDWEAETSDFINEYFDNEEEMEMEDANTFGIRNEDSIYIPECTICSKSFVVGEPFVTDVEIIDYVFGDEKYIICEKCHQKVIEAYQGKIEF